MKYTVQQESVTSDSGKEFNKLFITGSNNSSLTPYRIDPEYLDDFKTIVDHLLNESPYSLIYILASYQSESKEIVSGTYSLNTFLSLMEESKIYSNVCYIISSNEKAL